MEIKPINTEQDYRAALREASPLFDNEPEPATPEGVYFDALVEQIAAYEEIHYPIDTPRLAESIAQAERGEGREFDLVTGTFIDPANAAHIEASLTAFDAGDFDTKEV